MYDRKTWIVVIACSLLLAVNIFYQQQNSKLIAEQKKREAPELVSPPPASAPAAAAAAGESTSGSLVETPPVVQEVEQLVTLETSETIFTFTSVGGGLKHAEFKNQKHGIEGPVQLNRHGSSPIGAIAEGPDRLESVSYEFVDKDSVKDKTVVFRGRLPSGLWAKKTWSLVEGNPGSAYLLDFKLQLENPGEVSVNLENFSLFLGTAAALSNLETPDQTGFVLRDDGSFTFTKASSFAGGWFSKEKSIITEASDKAEYAGVANQFFATVVKPGEPGASLVWGKLDDVILKPGAKPVKAMRAGLQLPSVSLAPGEPPRSFSYQVFTGPKQNRILRKMGDDWGELMNYGMFSPFSRFMNWSLWWVHAGMGKISGKWSWGLAVIALTILLRTAIWPLYNRSNRTMKRMAKLKPEMDKLKEKYPDDPQKMNTEMMKLYRTYGVNPLGGCLPMFAQLPIFFGFFSMLQHAVEMRGAPFLWVNDLSLPDTVFVLPILGGIPINPLPIVMAITSVAQMAMMPNTGGDKTQMMVMKLMPIFFLFLCYNFASALALYWTVSNVFSIGQTWLSNRLPEPQLKPKTGGGGKSFVERMAERADAAQKMRQASGRVIDPKDDAGPSKKRPPRTGG